LFYVQKKGEDDGEMAPIDKVLTVTIFSAIIYSDTIGDDCSHETMLIFVDGVNNS
jgi:hypothetical protein